MIAPALKKTKVYITGGIKTVGAMVGALSSIDGVGLGRPACQEPHLPKDILEGKVKGAIRPRIDEDDFNTSLVAAGMHIQHFSKDYEPLDLSNEESMNGFLQDTGTWAEKMANDKEMKEQAWPVIVSVPSIPYGTVSS